MLSITDLQELCIDTSIAITKHAKNRLAERDITIANVKNAVQSGEIIKQYEHDKPFPSCLLLGKTEQGRYVHVVASIGDETLYIITAYYPDESEWENNFKTRKGH